MNKKLILLTLVGVGIVLFYVFDLQQYLSLEILKSNREELDVVYQKNTTAVILGFIGIYFLVVALSLPGATILTLAGGAVFGPVSGMLIGNIGATLGATAAFLVARFVLREWVEKKFGDKLEPFNKGFSKNAINYLLFLRLVPLFPFFPIGIRDAFELSGIRDLKINQIYEKSPGFKRLRESVENIEDINILFREKIVPVAINYGEEYLLAAMIINNKNVV